jgi:hypothetical protein
MHKELLTPHSGPDPESQFSINLSAFPAGVYFVTIVTPTASGTQKLVVK